MNKRMGAGIVMAMGLAASAGAQAPARRPLDFDHVIPNIPGKSVKTVVVNYGPGQASPAHAHSKSAFIVGYVLEGEILSAVNGQTPKVYRKGEYFTEDPGDHHTSSANASKTSPAKLLAIFIVDTKDSTLTTPLPAKP